MHVHLTCGTTLVYLWDKESSGRYRRSTNEGKLRTDTMTSTSRQTNASPERVLEFQQWMPVRVICGFLSLTRGAKVIVGTRGTL
jgi:hypothetical protein